MANEFIVKNGLIVGGNVVTSGTITINGALAATQSWVTSQAYLTSASLSGYATQSYVTSAISALVDAAPAALDTLNELAAALGDDANFSTTITNSIASKQAQLNGTGLVRMSGTSVSYDNTTYLVSNFGNIEGDHSYGYPSSEGWYKIAEIVLTSSCQSFNLWGEYRDTGYFDNSHYRIHITARAECDFPTNNESHAINVNMYGSSTNETYFNNNVRVVLTSSSSNYRKYELQYYRATWDTGSWNLQTLGWTTYTTSQTAGTPTGTPRVYYISKFVADNIYAANKISIGTTYSGFAANIAGTTYVIGASVWVNDGYGISNASSGGTGFFPYSDGNSVINSNNTTRLFVNGSTGNIGIGTSSPSEKLQVAGNIKIQNETGLITDYGPLIGRYNTSQIYIGTGGSYSIIKIGRDDGSALNVLSGGTIGIGTTSPVATLSVVGTVNLGAQASGFYNTNSVLHIAKSGVAQITFEDYQVTAGIAVAASVMSFGNQVSDATYRFKYNNIYNGNFASTGTTLVQFNPTTSYISTGNVGIGTTSPDTPLVVQGGSAGTGGWNRTATLSATYPGLIFNSNGTKWGGMAYDYSAAMRFWVNASNNDIFAGTLAMSILNNGNVGIGTSDPGAKLHVIGNAWVNRPSNKVDNASCTELPSRVEFNNAFTAGASGYTVFTYPTASVFRIYGDYDGNIGGLQPDLQLGLGYLTVKNSGGTIGNIGIGTTAPTHRLTVAGGNVLMFPSDNTRQLSFFSDSYGITASSGLELITGDYIRFRQGSTELARLTTTGLGIGTTSPSSALEVIGTIRNKNASANSNYSQLSTTEATLTLSTYSINTASYPANIIFSPASTEAMRINTAGKVSIGTTDTNSDKSDFTVYTGAGATIALTYDQVRMGGTDVNWGVAIRQSGSFETYGQALILGTSNGNYPINVIPNGTTSAQFYTDYTYFPGLDFAISRVNSTHGAGNFFRGDGSHLVIGTGGTLYLNYANTSGTTYIFGTTYINNEQVATRAWVGAQGYLTSVSDIWVNTTGDTMSGTLSFQQPVGLSFANGQYIKDNNSGGLIIYSNAAVNINGTTTIISNNATVGGLLGVTGIVSAGARKLSLGILDLNTSGTPGQYKIKTNIPWNYGGSDFTVNIKGFRYGVSQMVSLSVGWHFYADQFYSRNAISNGAWAPTITLAKSPDGYVIIHIPGPDYWAKLYVESVYSSNSADSYTSGWSWTDADLSDCTLIQTVPYRDLATSITGNSGTTSQTNFSSLTINSAAVATQAYVGSQGYLTSYSETDTLATVTNRGNSTTDRINVRGAGNQGGGNIMMGNTGESTNKWSYLTSTHYNASSQPQGFALIGGLATSGGNAVVIGGNIYETNPATEIQFWTHSTNTHNLGGTQRGVINSAGNWGIGTTNPGDYKLYVNGGQWGTLLRGGDLGTGSDVVRMIKSDGSAAMIVRGDGNVGIGTFSPFQRLDVDGNISLGSWTKPGSTYVGLRRADDGSFGGGGDSGLVIESYGHASPYAGDYSQRVHLRTHLYNGGSHNVLTAYGLNVGIGTTTPSTKLDVNGVISATSGNSTQWNTAYGWGNHASASYATTSYVTTQINNLINGAPGVLDTLDELAAALGDDANFATTVTNSIATKLPLAGGTITGTLSMATSGTNYIRMGVFPNSTQNTGEAWIGRAADRISGTMTVQLGGGSPAGKSFEIVDYAWSTVLFSVASTGNVTVAGTLTESSSLKLKENIETSEGNLEKVVNLRPVTYNKIGSQTTELGLIAEEVAEVYPEFVQYDENGEPIGVHYSRLTAALIGAVKELTNQVQELNKKING